MIDTIAADDSLPDDVIEGAGCVYYRTKGRFLNEEPQTDVIFNVGYPYAAMKIDGELQIMKLIGCSVRLVTAIVGSFEENTCAICLE
ncbi:MULTISPECIES: hypothetical protein [Prevotellaceae]|uniref:hypothetical protein n=1 Tax=Prevotellaceae TaxID=171552 RepID=UPI0003D32245|nr:hypothetical protein [Prevotella phocaeensis]ETD16930.1 hypothetical protein HMPREF1199_01965 [Hoylesella oralis CC98A]